jgi:predicted dehydrogenase
VSNRREFLLSSAVAVSQAAADREVRAAFIGVGRRGTSLVKLTLAQRNVRVAAVCDIDPQARDQALSMTARDNPKSVTEWRRVLEMSDVEAVIVGTPCDLHAPIAVACLEAGKYVY